MKSFKTLILFLLLTTTAGFCQVYNNGYRQRSYGSDKDRLYTESQKKMTPEEIEKDRSEKIDKLMAKLKEVLTLDELQYIAIRNEIASNSKNIDIVMKKEIPDEEKTNDIKAMMEKSNAVVNSYLNKEQKEKYKTFVDDVNSGKKGKKKKKEDAAQDKPLGE